MQRCFYIRTSARVAVFKALTRASGNRLIHTTISSGTSDYDALH